MSIKNITKSVLVVASSIILSLSACSTSNSRSEKGGLDLSKDYEKVSTGMSYKNLATLDLDQVNDLIQVKINEYSKQNSIQSLKEATLILFSRPDEDGMIEKIISNVRNPLEEENQWQNTIEGLVRQSVETMKNSEAKQSDQVTAGITLENILAEFKPTYIKQYKTGGFETKIVDYIAEEDLLYSKQASKERGLYLMRNNLNPTQIAQKFISNKENFLEKEQKQEKNKKK